MLFVHVYVIMYYNYIIGDEVQIHFDGWNDGYDYWCSSDAVELHPVGWCSRHGWELQKPRGINRY